MDGRPHLLGVGLPDVVAGRRPIEAHGALCAVLDLYEVEAISHRATVGEVLLQTTLLA